MQSSLTTITYEIMIPNVIRLPSIIIKLPRCAAGEHSAWYAGTVDVYWWQGILNITDTAAVLHTHIKAIPQASDNTCNKHLRITERCRLENGTNNHDYTPENDSSTPPKPISNPKVGECTSKTAEFLGNIRDRATRAIGHPHISQLEDFVKSHGWDVVQSRSLPEILSQTRLGQSTERPGTRTSNLLRGQKGRHHALVISL